MNRTQAYEVLYAQIDRNDWGTQEDQGRCRLALETLAPTAQSSCIGSDPLCPCQDGDSCHYVSTKKTKAFPIPQSEPARDVEEAANRDPVAEVGEFGGVTFFKELDPNTLLFTRPWLDSEIEMARMQAAEMATHLNERIEMILDEASTQATEAPSAQQQPESGS